MTSFDKENLWELADQIWVVVMYGLIAWCVYKNAWAEGTFWLIWVMFDRLIGLVKERL